MNPFVRFPARIRRSAAVTTLAIVITAVLVSPALAQPCQALRVRNADGNYIVPGVKGDIAYSGDLALDAYIQPGTNRRPSVVVVHGGTWSSGGRAAHVGQILELLTLSGYNWFSVDYRLAGLEGVAESLADLRAALAFIRCRARGFGIDAERLVLLGEDSGAHLAALLSAERPAGVVGALLLGGYYDLAAAPGLTRDDTALLARLSPIKRLDPAPPLLVVHGSADSDVPIEQARRYCDAVVQAAGRCRLVTVEGASHRSENWWPSQWGYKREMVEWLSTIAPVPPRASGPAAATRLVTDVVYSESPRLTLNAFTPRSSRPTPAVILVHGGGWEAGDKVTYVTPLFEPLARAGLAWFSIDYRLTPAASHQDQLADVRQAIRFVRASAARFNIDPSKIVLLGESASGQMAAQIATEDRSLAGVVSFYGVYDLEAMVTDASPRSLLVRLFGRTVLDDEARRLLRQFSPLHQAHKDMPPLLLINGTGERLWAQAQAFSRRLTDLGATHDVIPIEGAPHGLENWEGRAEWLAYKPALIAWIRARFANRE